MPLEHVPVETLRTACRQRIESCELQLRRLIHDKFIAAYGANYVANATMSGNAVFRSEIQNHIRIRREAQPSRYERHVDALELDHLSSLLCKVDVYNEHFKEAFQAGFPLGHEQLRFTLNQLVPIRNALSHANPVSTHDAGKVICYCDDIAVSLSKYYQAIGMSNDFDAPSFTKAFDSKGNVGYPTKTFSESINFTAGESLRSGETVRCEVEVDPRYSENDFSIHWGVNTGPERAIGTSFVLTLRDHHVGAETHISVYIKSTKTWHRHGDYDAWISLIYKVLPPN